MKKNSKRLKRKALKKNFEAQGPINAFIQPFKEMPSISTTEKDSADRISAHDLFSRYTADILNEDIIYYR